MTTRSDITVPAEALAEAFSVMRDDRQFQLQMSYIDKSNRQAKHEAFHERFGSIADAHGVETDELLRSLADLMHRTGALDAHNALSPAESARSPGFRG